MNESEFLKRNQPAWNRLQYLSAQIEQSPEKASPKDLEEFLQLYRQAAGDLAKARAESHHIEMIESLNAVVSRAYSVLYRKPRHSILSSIDSILYAGASAFRNQFRVVLVSLVLMMGSSFFASTVLHHRPDLRYRFVAPQMEPLFEDWKKGSFEHRDSDSNALMTGFYMGNNPRVALTTSAIGASTFGLGSAYILYQNGVLLGALAYDMWSVGKLGFLLSSIAPHGASELTGAIVAGSSGFVLGLAVINPGKRRRLDALREKGKDAFSLMIMGIIMMYVAAPFEGFFSFNASVPQSAKVAMAILVFSAWCLFWYFYGRGRDKPTEA
jgi:uncharacterized membrane protein SpoIIM required for sporulation